MPTQMPVEALETEVLRLSTADRVRLLDGVMASLDEDKARDLAWDKLAAERLLRLPKSRVARLP